MSAGVLRVQLPYLACVDCNRQLVTHLFARYRPPRMVDSLGGPVPGYELLCIHCAGGSPGCVVAVSPDAEGWLPGVAAMGAEDAVRLLVSLGAQAVCQ